MTDTTSAVARTAKALNLFQRGQYQDALNESELALTADPSAVEAHNIRGLCLVALGDASAGIAAYSRVLAHAPLHENALTNRGTARLRIGEYEDALRDLEAAVAANPGYALAHFNLARGYLAQNRTVEALQSYDNVLTLVPGDPKTLWAKGVAQLLAGDFVNGWANYIWRWRAPDFGNGAPREYGAPRYTGVEPIAGRTLFVHAEQGFGDTIQFCRYIPQLAATGARVIFMLQAELIGLLAASGLPCELLASPTRVPCFDYDLPLMNAPAAMKTTLATVPAQVPYLTPPVDKKARWAELLGTPRRQRIGIAWSGRRTHPDDRLRSMPVEALAPVFDLDAEIHVVQDVVTEAERAFLAGRARIFDISPRDFGDAAAHVAALDHVISVDTSLAHLAGALAKSVAILLPASPDFRWLLDRSDSPWYPTATLFRQNTIGRWDDVVAGATAHVAAPRSRSP